jgi:hypothetical protein
VAPRGPRRVIEPSEEAHVKKELTRRDLIGRAGLAIGGALSLGVVNACSSNENSASPPPPAAGPEVNQFPYQQHLAASYRLDAAAVQEAAYHGYYAGGCCHGAYNALVKHLADTAGAPFDKLPLDFGMFGGGGIAGFGSICGAVLGGVLVVNSLVPNLTAPATLTAAQKTVRNRMMVELMRWYEQTAFPAYTPVAVDAGETGLTLGFNDGSLPAPQQVAPGSHLCHASVTGWCAANGNVPSSGPDKKARCARLTADVAGKVVEMVNAYLASGEFVAGAANATTGCVGCHSQTATAPAAPVAAGMECTTCHPTAGHPFPATQAHDPASNCGTCH